MGNKAAIVLGMHRTGSSAAMGILRILGVDIGDDLGGKNDYNEKGYLENQEFYRWEQKILIKSGGNWQSIPSLNVVNSTFGFYEKEYMMLLEKYNRSPYWGYKAIRGGLFPDHLTLIENPHFIVCWRSPKAVADSLRRRNGFTRQKSIGLWATYYYRIFSFLGRSKLPYMILNYDELVDDTEETVLKIAKFLMIEFTKEKRKKTEEWIEKGLRHF